MKKERNHLEIEKFSKKRFNELIYQIVNSLAILSGANIVIFILTVIISLCSALSFFESFLRVSLVFWNIFAYLVFYYDIISEDKEFKRKRMLFSRFALILFFAYGVAYIYSHIGEDAAVGCTLVMVAFLLDDLLLS